MLHNLNHITHCGYNIKQLLKTLARRDAEKDREVDLEEAAGAAAAAGGGASAAAEEGGAAAAEGSGAAAAEGGVPQVPR